MGVSLASLVSGKEIDFQAMEGRIIAVDAYNTLYQFLSSIRDRFTGEPLKDSSGRITSHLSGLFYRTSRLMETGINPVFVFDGKPPDFKHATIEARIAVRKKAKAKWEEALEKGDSEAVRRYSQGASRLTEEMVEEAKKLLTLLGISCIQAPSEGEAQATRLLRDGKAWAVGSQDWDSLLFGAERVIRNLTISGRRKVAGKEKYIEIRPELVELPAVLKNLGINQDQLILLGILVGTDYNPGGIRGVGPKTALKLVKEHKTPEKLFDVVDWESPTPPEKVFEFFKNPPTEDIEIKKEELQPERLKEFLEDHDFSHDRTASTMKKLDSKKQKQKGLGSFFGR